PVPANAATGGVGAFNQGLQAGYRGGAGTTLPGGAPYTPIPRGDAGGGRATGPGWADYYDKLTRTAPTGTSLDWLAEKMGAGIGYEGLPTAPYGIENLLAAGGAGLRSAAAPTGGGPTPTIMGAPFSFGEPPASPFSMYQYGAPNLSGVPS